MITIIPVKTTQDQTHIEDFYKSLRAQWSGAYLYEVVTDRPGVEFSVASASPDSRIQIYLPDNCLVLGNSWDKYVDYFLKNGTPNHWQGQAKTYTWWDTVIRYLGLIDRAQRGNFEEVKVVVPEKPLA